jgi:hypothetical protein
MCRNMQQLVPNRIVIYAKDVMNITGLRERAARALLARIRMKYRKKKGEFVSIEEFCQFTGLKEERVRPFLAL